MVKIVELDDTETVGLASAGIGLAGSELPNKRRKKKTQSMDPLGGLRGMGGGARVGGEHAEEVVARPHEYDVQYRARVGAANHDGVDGADLLRV